MNIHNARRRIRGPPNRKKPAPFQFVTCGNAAGNPRKLGRISKTNCILKNRDLAASTGTQDNKPKRDLKTTKSISVQPARNITYSGNKQFKCAYCDYKSKRILDLKNHMTKHSYTCNICTYRTNTIIRLMAHRLTHVKKEGRKSKGGRSVDSSLKTPEPSGNKSNEPGVLRTYMSGQKDEKLFKCNFCNYKCKWSGTLKKHFSNEHPGKKH